MSIGEQIREIAMEIERLDPSKAPFFMGVERPTPSSERYMLQGFTTHSGVYALTYAQRVLAEVKAAAKVPIEKCGLCKRDADLCRCDGM